MIKATQKLVSPVLDKPGGVPSAFITSSQAASCPLWAWPFHHPNILRKETKPLEIKIHSSPYSCWLQEPSPAHLAFSGDCYEWGQVPAGHNRPLMSPVGKICKHLWYGMKIAWEVNRVWEARVRSRGTTRVYSACAAQTGPRPASVNIRTACWPSGGLTQAREPTAEPSGA